MAGQHDDRRVGITIGAGLPDHLGQFETVENGHRPIGHDDVGHVMGKGFEAGCAVFGFVDFARSETVQQRPQDAAHMRIVVDDEETQAVEVDPDHKRPWCGGLSTLRPR